MGLCSPHIDDELWTLLLRYVVAVLLAAVYLEPPRSVVGCCSLSRYLYTRYACTYTSQYAVSSAVDYRRCKQKDGVDLLKRVWRFVMQKCADKVHGWTGLDVHDGYNFVNFLFYLISMHAEYEYHKNNASRFSIKS